MKKVLAFLAAIILISSLTACNLSDEDPENVLNRLDSIVGLIGNSQITSDESLVGVRNNTEDSYTGEYIAKCNGQTGRDGAPLHSGPVPGSGDADQRLPTGSLRGLQRRRRPI